MQLTLSDKTLYQLTPEQMVVRIYHNLDLLDQMVGTLYPPIIEDENSTLRSFYRALTGEECPI
jgi:hypothetical protein